MQPTAQSFGCNRATDAIGYPARVVLTRSLRHRGCSAAGSWQTPLVETNEKTQDVVDRFSGYNQIPGKCIVSVRIGVAAGGVFRCLAPVIDVRRRSPLRKLWW